MRRVAAPLAVFALAAGLLSALAGPAGAAPRCFGRAATILGTSGPDQIVGTPQDDVIVAKGGRDIVAGLDGDDRICGGDEADDIAGMKGGDRIDGGDQGDVLVGQDGRDLLVGGRGADLQYGGGGNDRLKGLAGDDSLLGQQDDDTLDGGTGRDRLYGGGGDDLIGGGAGRDLASFFFSARGVTANLTTDRARGEGTDRLAGIEDLSGSDHDDRLIGDELVNLFFGLRGDDVFEGLNEIDTVSFATSDNPVTADLETDEASGEGQDSLLGIEHLAGSRFGDTLRGDAFQNILFGFDGRDELFGRAADDVLNGGRGTDTGAGGLHGLGGDICISVENETGCES